MKNIPSKIKDIFPTKEEIKDKWQEYTEKIKDFSETLYLYGLEYKDKLKDFGETLYLHGLEYKDKLKDFGETLYLHGLEFWDKWKEDIYPSVKESLTDFKERGKEFFNSAKEMVSSGISKLWGGIKSVGRWGIDKLGNIKDKFSNKAGELTDKMFKKGLQKVYVEGGHLDTVGAIGANDLDYFEEVRKKSESKENSNTEDKDINFKSINHASVMDKYQDEGTPAEKKSHSLLKEIAEKEGGSSGEGSGSGDSLSEEVKDWLLAGSSGLSLFAALKEKIANSGVGQSISGGIQNAKIGGKLYMDQAKDFFTNGGINNMWQSGKQMASSGISGISNMWHSGKQMATNAGSSIKNWFTGIGGGLSGLYASTKAGILGAGSSIASWAGTAVGSAGIGTIIGTVMAGAAIGILIGLYLQRFIYDDVETMEDAWNKFKDGAGALVDPKVWKYIGETIKKYFVGEKSELEQMISFIENNDKLSDEQKKKYIRTLIERQAKYTEESVIDKVTKDFEEKYSDGSDDKNTDDLIRSANEKDNKKDSSRNNNTSSGSTSGSGPGSLLNTGSFVNQMSSRYNDLYVGGRKFSENGCAPSVMSMLLSNYGKNIPIDTLTKEANRYSSNRGVDLKYFKDTLEKYNIAGRTQTTDITGLVSRLNDNEQAVLLTKSRDGNGHYVLVKKSNNKLTLFDPLKGNRKTISINDQAIKNASLAYVTEPNLNTNEMLNLNGYQTRVGAGVGAGVDLLTGQRRDRINQLVDNQRLNQLNKIRDLKDRVKIGRQIEREINNTISNKTKTESLNYIGVDNSRIEKKLDTLITEIKKLADVFVNVGKEIVNNSNTNNVVSKQNTNNINNSNEERIDENVRDVFIDTITRISSGVLT
ncbi:MAG: cysteine peptidase family C39 domain-containing protein [bacterium]